MITKLPQFIESIIIEIITQLFFNEALQKWFWVNFLEFEIKLWHILSIGFFLIYIRSYLNLKDNPKIISNDWFLKYQTDVINALTWKWEWVYNNYTGLWNVTNIKPVCPKCETKMLTYNSFGMYSSKCPRCETHISKLKSEREIEAIVMDNLERKLIKSQNLNNQINLKK